MLEVKQKVQVWIFCRHPKLRFLLLKTTAIRNSFWQPVTGSVEKGETLTNAALREAYEETGLTFQGPILDLQESFEYSKNGHRFEEHGFYLEAKDQLSDIRLDPYEHDQAQWCAAQEALEKLKFDSNIQILRAVLRSLKAEL